MAILLSLLGFIFATSAGAAVATAEDAWQHVAFGFVNDDGTFTVSGDERGANFDPADITGFVREGRVHSVSVKTSEEDQGRYLEVKGPRNVTGLAVPAIIAERFKLLPLRKIAAPSCTPKLMTRLKAAANRKVVRCQATHAFGGDGRDGEVGYVVFEKTLTGLAGFFVATPVTLSLERHETTPGHGWREGDGGTFAADDLNFLWALRRKQDGAYGIAYTWGLGEGTHTAVAIGKQAKLERVFSHFQFNSAGGL